MIIRYSEWVFVAFAIQREMRMPRIILSYVACLDVPHFPTISLKRHDFREKIMERKISIFIFSTTFVGNISHSKKNYIRSCHK